MVQLKKLAKHLLRGRMMIVLTICVAILVPVLAYRYHYPTFTVKQLERYQVRLNQMVDTARRDELRQIEEPSMIAFGREYDEAFRLPVLFANLSHRAVLYRAREEDNTYYLFICGRSKDGTVTRAFQYAERRDAPPLHEKVLTNWSMEGE